MSFHPSMGQDALPNRPATVTCVLPGLVWPASGVGAALPTSQLPGLAAILGRSKIVRQKGESLLAWLAQSFGANEQPWGARRLAGEPSQLRPQQTNAHILCADPVGMVFTQDALLIRSPRELALTQAETDALLATLNAEFAELGRFYAATPERWYLETERPCARFHPLLDVIGRPAAFFPPEGEQARDWNRLANAIQIALHAHPINQARSERGLIAANAIWFWGQGGGASQTLQAPAARLVSNDSLLRGMAHAATMQVMDPAAAGSPANGLPGHTWWHDASLLEAALNGDFMAWSAALVRLDTELLQPLWRAFQAGEATGTAPAGPR